MIRPTLTATRFQSTLLMRGATRRYCRPGRSARISIHAPHARSDLAGSGSVASFDISIHAPHARSDSPRDRPEEPHHISIHAPHARSDTTPARLRRRKSISIHAPHARSDWTRSSSTWIRIDISIHAPHARSDVKIDLADILDDISIHAPHARSDIRRPRAAVPFLYFNPRSSCEERRARASLLRAVASFQSTLLMRGATQATWPSWRPSKFQSTLLMRGATHGGV